MSNPATVLSERGATTKVQLSFERPSLGMFRLTGTVPAPTAPYDDAEAAHAYDVIALPRRMKMLIRPVLIIVASASLTRMSVCATDAER